MGGRWTRIAFEILNTCARSRHLFACRSHEEQRPATVGKVDVPAVIDPAAVGGAPPHETKVEKRIRLNAEREERKRAKELEKDEKRKEKEKEKEKEKAMRLAAGEKEDDIKEEERMAKLANEAQAQLRRYSTINLSAQIPLTGLDVEDAGWMEFKDLCLAVCEPAAVECLLLNWYPGYPQHVNRSIAMYGPSHWLLDPGSTRPGSCAPRLNMFRCLTWSKNAPIHPAGPLDDEDSQGRHEQARDEDRQRERYQQGDSGSSHAPSHGLELSGNI